MSASNIPEAQRARMGISDSLIRIAVGLEHHQDIIDDLEQALAKI
ncbi:MAG: PLP-dependent transferase, partial [Gammaproteobacteria bacterium]|nr:PLP-dependent transferase [Gammaproteobacteria bacterium]